jgi:hypothetical protein
MMQVPGPTLKSADGTGGGSDAYDRSRIRRVLVRNKAPVVFSSANWTRYSGFPDPDELALRNFIVAGSYIHRFIVEPSFSTLPHQLLAIMVSFQQTNHTSIGVTLWEYPGLLGRVEPYPTTSDRISRDAQCLG